MQLNKINYFNLLQAIGLLSAVRSLRAFLSLPATPCGEPRLLWHGHQVVWIVPPRRLGVLIGAWFFVGCSLLEQPASEKAAPAFPVTVSAQSDGKPVAGAKVLNGKQVLGVTDDSGKARLKLLGQEGDSVNLSIQCPAGLGSPEKPIGVGLRALAKGSPEPTFETTCVPLAYEVVVGVRTKNGGNLPILYLDEVIGHTNPEGVAHFKLKVAPKEQITLKLDTSDHAELRPQNPTLTFVAEDKDEMVLLEQRFTVVRKKVVAPKIHVPQPL